MPSGKKALIVPLQLLIYSKLRKKQHLSTWITFQCFPLPVCSQKIASAAREMSNKESSSSKAYCSSPPKKEIKKTHKAICSIIIPLYHDRTIQEGAISKPQQELKVILGIDLGWNSLVPTLKLQAIPHAYFHFQRSVKRKKKKKN